MSRRHPTSAAELVELLRRHGIRDPRVLEAMRTVDRARFVPAPLQARAWDDVALPIGAEQTISQPFIVAMMTAALALRGDETVLEIGTGSGYQTAVLCRLCRRLVTIERLPELADPARQVLDSIGCNNVEYHVWDGTLGSPAEAPFDGILAAAAAPRVPPALYEQLTVGGRLVLPVGEPHAQQLLCVTKTPRGPHTQPLGAVRFVPLIGAQGWPP